MGALCVVGGGIFGITAAIELRRRGHEVTLVDPGPIPHPLAESTDISKIVRLDYGDDETYTELMERALEAWRSWSAARYFHETGVLFLKRTPLEPGSFEHDSLTLLERRGHRLDILDRTAIEHRFPEWTGMGFGYFNPQGGWAESGRVVAHLGREAADLGVRLAGNTPVARLRESTSRVTGVVTESGETLDADTVVVAAGAWTPALLPSLRVHLHPVVQPVFHLAPETPSRFAAKRFPVFGADIARTGWYGFPVNAEGVVKIANHGAGRPMRLRSAPSETEADERRVTEAETKRLRDFLAEALPTLAGAPIVSTRGCVYCDTDDQHFWIAPERPGLVVAAGGSGHAFKFAPLLGAWISDAVEGKVHPKFRARAVIAKGEERARHQGGEA
jgi:glycine/D-amino acid oxidase-like deaminating enzyme